MVAPSSLQHKKNATSQVEHREAERESYREEPRCRHTAAGNAKKRKSGAESSARMFAAVSPSTSGRLGEQQERSKARKGHEIDVLFAAQPTKVPAAPKQSAPKHSASKRTDKAAGSKDDLFGNRPAKARRRLDGLPVYTTDELKVNEGGGTPDCPFNCECCF